MKVPGPTVDQIVKGVKPIVGEIGRYHVASRSSHKAHLVDINENGFYGQCDCEAFTFNYAPKLRNGIPTDSSLQCYHIKQANRHFAETMKRRLWHEMHKQQERREQEPIGRVEPRIAPVVQQQAARIRIEPPQRRQYVMNPNLTYAK